MLRVFGQTLPSNCVEGTQCFEEYLHHGIEPWRNDHGTTVETTAGTTADPVMTITLSSNSFSMEVNEAKMAIYILSGCILSLRKLVYLMAYSSIASILLPFTDAILEYYFRIASNKCF